MRLALAICGIVALAGVVRHAGPATILALVDEALPWMPLVLVLEGARIGCDALATGLVLKNRAHDLGSMRIMLAHVVAHGVMNVLPGGRGAAEVAKGLLFRRDIGAATATALGAANQANVLVSAAAFSVPCAIGASLISSDRTLVFAIAIHSTVLFSTGLAVRALATSQRFAHVLGSRVRRWKAPLQRYMDASREVSRGSAGPVAAMMFGRALQTLQFAVLAQAVGLRVDVAVALAIQGADQVAAAVGVLVPAQIGMSEGVFMLAANALGTTEARATSVALLAHASSLTWAGAGMLLLFVWRGRAQQNSS